MLKQAMPWTKQHTRNAINSNSSSSTAFILRGKNAAAYSSYQFQTSAAVGFVAFG
jgi:hypothetical protein